MILGIQVAYIHLDVDPNGAQVFLEPPHTTQHLFKIRSARQSDVLDRSEGSYSSGSRRPIPEFALPF